MGTTGSSDKQSINTALPDIVARVREYATVPIAVGFGVANRSHFETVADAGADGVVIGSRIVTVIKNAPKDQVSQHVEAFCREISLKGEPQQARSPLPTSKPSTPSVPPTLRTSSENLLPARFGQFGGQYVPEALVDCLAELEEAHQSAMVDPEFQKEFRSYYGYMNRPSQFYLAENLTKDAGGAKIWLKREDLYVTLSFSSPRARLMTYAETIPAPTKLTTPSARYASFHNCRFCYINPDLDPTCPTNW